MRVNFLLGKRVRGKKGTGKKGVWGKGATCPCMGTAHNLKGRAKEMWWPWAKRTWSVSHIKYFYLYPKGKGNQLSQLS